MPQPQQLDFRALADGVVRNNVGVDGITVAVRGRIAGDTAVLADTGQRLPLAGGAAAPAAPPGAWLWFAVQGFGPDEEVALVPLGASEGPWLRPADAPADAGAR